MKNNLFTNLMMRSAGGGMDAALRKHLLSSDTIATTNQRRSETDQLLISNRCRVGGEQTIAAIATIATIAKLQNCTFALLHICKSGTAHFARLAAMLLMLVTMSVSVWGAEDVVVTVANSSGGKMTVDDNDYISAVNPVTISSGLSGSSDGTAFKVSVPKSSTGTATFVLSAESNIVINSINISSKVNDGALTSGSIQYKINSGSLSEAKATTFQNGSFGNSLVSDGLINLLDGDELIIVVNLSNTHASSSKAWTIQSITFNMDYAAIRSGDLFGLETEASTTSGGGSTNGEQFSGLSHVSVTRNVGSVAENNKKTDGATQLRYGSASYYSKVVYKNSTSSSNYIANEYVGYQVVVEDGYSLNLTKLIAQMYTTANFKWKVEIIKESNVLYSTGDITASSYNGDSKTGLDKKERLSNKDILQNLTGTFYVRVSYCISSSSKYLCFPKLQLKGIVTYNVTYNMKGHGDAIPQETGVTALPDPLPEPTASGWTFGGWYTDEALTQSATAGASISANTTLYAKWTSGWKFMYNGDSYSEHTTTAEDTHSVSYTVSLDAYTTYWFRLSDGYHAYKLAGEGTMSGVSCTDWALYKDNGYDCGIRTTVAGDYKFTIDDTHADNDDSNGARLIVSVAYPSSADRTIYLNPGVWNDAGAKFAIYYYDGSLNGWSNLMTPDPCEPSVYKATIPAGYTSMNAVRLNSDATVGTWDKKWNQTANIAITADDYISITDWGSGDSPYTYATYSAAKRSITFDGNGNTSGSMTNVSNINCGSNVTLAPNAFVKTGYTFSGWNDGSNDVADEATIENITSDITLTAQWTPIEYTITYNGLEGATNTGNPATYTFESSLITFVAPGSRTGYTFSAWSPATIAAGSTGNKTVTASWTANQYTITYKDQGDAAFSGSFAGEYPTTHTYGSATQLVNPTRDGYTFDGWYGNYACTGVAMTSVGATTYSSNFTLYAKWTANQYTVTLNTNGGTINAGNIANYTYGTGATLPTNVTKEDYTFAGWFDNEGLTGDAVTTIANDATGAKEYWAKWTEDEPSGDCVNSIFYCGTADATDKTQSTYITGITTGTQGISGTLTIDEESYVATKGVQISTSGKISITVPSGKTATLYVLAGSSSSSARTMKLTNSSSVEVGTFNTAASSSEATQASIENLSAGTYTLVTTGGGANIAIIALKLCGGSTPPTPVDPTVTFSNGAYTVGGAALDLSTLFTSNSGGAVTYSVKNANGTGATVAGSSFTATTAGTATVQASQVATGEYNAKVVTATITVSAASPEPGDDCNEIGYGTSTEMAINATSGDLQLVNSGAELANNVTPFSGESSTKAINVAGDAKYITGNLGGKEIESLTVAANSSNSSQKTVLVLFSSETTFSKQTILAGIDGEVGVNVRNLAIGLNSEAKTEYTITAPAGAKSFAITRNFTDVEFVKKSTDPAIIASSLSGSRYVYYIKACAKAACTGSDAELAYGTTAVNKTESDDAFVNALTNPHSVAVTYTSTNTSVATVAADGTVTIVGAGSTTIKAASAEQTISETTYCADEVSYTLTVTAAPSYTVTVNSSVAEHDCSQSTSAKAGQTVTITNTCEVDGYTLTGYNSTPEVSGTLVGTTYTFTMLASNVTLTAVWVADAPVEEVCTKVYDFNDHTTDGTNYTNAEGASSATKADDQDLTSPLTLVDYTSNAAEQTRTGITSVVLNNATCDFKVDNKWITAYLKLKKGGANVVITMAQAGKLKIKAGSYDGGSNRTLTLTDAASNQQQKTTTGAATTKDNFTELEFDLAEGVNTLTCSGSTYISNMEICINGEAACQAPVITAQPQDVDELKLEQTTTLTVEAIGAASVQWYACASDGSNHYAIDGATSMSYTTTTVGQAVGSAYYFALLTSACGDMVQTNIAHVTTVPLDFTIHYTALSTKDAVPASEAEFTESIEVTPEATTMISNLTNFAFTGVTRSDKGKEGTMSQKISMPTEEDDSKYVSFSFDIKRDYMLDVEELTFQMQPVNNANHNYKVTLTDELGTVITGTSTTNTKGSLNTITFPASELEKNLVGHVVVKIFAWFRTEDTYRLAKNTYIKGEIKSIAAPELHWTKIPADGTIGDKMTIVATSDDCTGTITYASENTDVATVDAETGLLTYVAEGTANIKATIAGDGLHFLQAGTTISQEITISVAAVSGVMLNKSTMNLIVDDPQHDSETLTATILPANAGNKNVTWESNNTAVATVDENGVVTAVAVGVATVTVTTVDGSKTANCVVTVTAPQIGGDEVCLEVLGASGEESGKKVYTFSEGSKLYSCNKEFGPVSSDPTTAASNQSIKTCAGNENIYTYNKKYMVLWFTEDIIGLKLKIYKNSARNISQIQTSTSFLDSRSWTDVEYTTPNNSTTGCQELTAEFSEPIAAGTYVAILLSNDAVTYGVCYTPVGDKATKPVLPTLTDLTKNIGENASWNATITNAAAVTEAGESVTYVWKDENGQVIGTTATLNLNAVTMAQAGEYTVTATVTGTDKSPNTASQTVTLTVNCQDVKPEVYEVSSTEESKTFGARNSSTHANYTEGTFQWYRGDEIIAGASAATYTATQAGQYYVEYINHCTTRSDNYGDFTPVDLPEASRLAPFQYCHKGNTYTESRKMVHLFHYVAKGEDTETHAKYVVTATVDEIPFELPANAVVEDNETEGDLLLNLNILAKAAGLNIGDDVVLTVKPYTSSNQPSETISASIIVHIIGETPTLAFIVSGTNKVGGTKTKKEHTKGGDFLTGVNVADLCFQTGLTTWNAGAELPLYAELKKEFLVTPVNGYAKFNKYNYEPFDLVFLTDFPKTDVDGTALNDLAELVDYRPLFSTKAYVSGLSKWQELGIEDKPIDPKTPQLWMSIQCKTHTMFHDVEFSTVPQQEDTEEFVFTMLSGEGYDNHKALQGFELSSAGDFVKVASNHYNAHPDFYETVVDDETKYLVAPVQDGVDDRLLVTSFERQVNMDARMIMLVLNADATSKLTKQGLDVITSALHYLLVIDENEIVDCSINFEENEAAQDGNFYWSNTANWPDKQQPKATDKIRIKGNCIVDIPTAVAAEVKICTGVGANGHLTIQPTAALQVEGKIYRVEDGHYSRTMPTTVSDIYIQSSDAGTGVLVHGDHDGNTGATVEMYSKAYKESVDGKTKSYWQYVGAPTTNIYMNVDFVGATTYRYAEGNGWIREKTAEMTPWVGYGIAQQESKTYVFQGNLYDTQNKELDLTYNGGGENLLANSWSAPIQIAAMEETDFGEADPTIYIWNTGHHDNDDATYSEASTTAGQWQTIPLNTMKQQVWEGYKTIPSGQAFQVNTTTATTLTLDYDRVVRKDDHSNQANNGNILHAPSRKVAQAEVEQVDMMRIVVESDNMRTDQYLLENEMFTEDYDRGWDGNFVEGDDRAASFYSVNPNGNMAINALPDLEGTQLGFVPNSDNQFTISFRYNGSTNYYLNDLQMMKSTLIQNGNTYTFFTSDYDMVERFVISKTPFQVPGISTGVDENGTILAEKVQKIFINGKLFIIRDGRMYDAHGKIIQ